MIVYVVTKFLSIPENIKVKLSNQLNKIKQNTNKKYPLVIHRFKNKNNIKYSNYLSNCRVSKSRECTWLPGKSLLNDFITLTLRLSSKN